MRVALELAKAAIILQATQCPEGLATLASLWTAQIRIFGTLWIATGPDSLMWPAVAWRLVPTPEGDVTASAARHRWIPRSIRKDQSSHIFEQLTKCLVYVRVFYVRS